MSKNLELLKRFADNVQALCKEAEAWKDEERIIDAIRTIRVGAKRMMIEGDGFSCSDVHPEIWNDVYAVAEGMEVEERLTDSHYDNIVQKVLDLDYSDYNEYIEQLIEEIIEE